MQKDLELKYDGLLVNIVHGDILVARLSNSSCLWSEAGALSSLSGSSVGELPRLPEIEQSLAALYPHEWLQATRWRTHICAGGGSNGEKKRRSLSLALALLASTRTSICIRQCDPLFVSITRRLREHWGLDYQELPLIPAWRPPSGSKRDRPQPVVHSSDDVCAQTTPQAIEDHRSTKILRRQNDEEPLTGLVANGGLQDLLRLAVAAVDNRRTSEEERRAMKEELRRELREEMMLKGKGQKDDQEEAPDEAQAAVASSPYAKLQAKPTSVKAAKSSTNAQPTSKRSRMSSSRFTQEEKKEEEYEYWEEKKEEEEEDDPLAMDDSDDDPFAVEDDPEEPAETHSSNWCGHEAQEEPEIYGEAEAEWMQEQPAEIWVPEGEQEAWHAEEEDWQFGGDAHDAVPPYQSRPPLAQPQKKETTLGQRLLLKREAEAKAAAEAEAAAAAAKSAAAAKAAAAKAAARVRMAPKPKAMPQRAKAMPPGPPKLSLGPSDGPSPPAHEVQPQSLQPQPPKMPPPAHFFHPKSEAHAPQPHAPPPPPPAPPSAAPPSTPPPPHLLQPKAHMHAPQPACPGAGILPPGAGILPPAPQVVNQVFNYFITEPAAGHNKEPKAGKVVQLDVREVNFTQDSCGDTFSCGKRLEDTWWDLMQDEITPDDLPRIGVVWVQDLQKWVSLDNRRLLVLKEYATTKSEPVRIWCDVKFTATDYDSFARLKTRWMKPQGNETVRVRTRSSSCSQSHVGHQAWS
eukprot:TRINITY_DN3392_c0_g1_i1.p1 TRINITY_DN3392_c0_g1~~TRINITY_DN3392_c0_g1_i1.p1  ORF type:complete len:742 (-),score=182.09 TRINITY_DN3392_c0_g1_i1:62-2287(-)